MKRSLLKLMSLTLALLMVVSTFSGMIVFGVSAEDAVVEEPASEPAATAANTVENLFYPVMMHARPSDVRLEYGDGIEAEARGSGSSIPSDIVIRRIYQVAGRAFSVKAGDVIYYLAKDTNAYFYQYDAKGATITSSTGGEWAYPSNYTYTVTNHGSFGWIANYEWFLCSITVPEGTAYLAPSFTTDNATKHFITKNYQFTKEDYNAYWEAFDVDANTGITLDKDSNLAGKNILFLGDSTMSGANDIYAPTTGKGIAGRIALATGANVYNLALGESTSSSGIKDIGFVMGTGYTVADQFASRDTSVTYDAVVIWAGIHDARNQKSNGDETYPAFLSVVSSIETAYPNAKIFAISGPFRDTNYGGNGLQPGIHSRIKAWGDADASDNYYCIDIYSDTEVTEKLMYASAKYLPDAINPTSDAYDMITPYILDDMEAAFYVPEPLVNYYYPLMKHTNPSYTILEYGEGITANDRGTGSSIPTDIVRFREWQVSGRAFAVEPGDVIYFIEKEGIGDRFFKYDAEGKSLSTISGSGGYTNLVPTLEVTDHGYWGWIGSYGWNLFSVTIPEAAEGEAQIAYIAPGLTTDNMDRHFITKNQPFTKAEWEAYWAAFDKDANTGLTYDAESALNGKNILFMGDPTMYGINDYWAPSTGRGIPGRVALATGAKVTNIAKSDFVSSKAIENGFLSGGSGNTVADQFANREDKTTVYDAVVIWAGIHDARNERDNDAVLDAMKAVVADIEAAYPNAKIFVIGGPYRDTNYGGNGKQGGLHNRFSAWGAESETDNHYYIDLFSPEEIKTALNYASSEYLPDGINPTSDGYDILAPYVISAMEEAYAPAEPDETEPEETEPEETDPPETEAPERTDGEYVNLYYPLKRHAKGVSIIEYGDGITSSDRGTGSDIPSDKLTRRIYRFAGRAIAVKEGDVLYYTNGASNSTEDPFYKYDSTGALIDTWKSTGDYAYINVAVESTLLYTYSYNGCSMAVYKYVVPAGVSYVLPVFTTDNGDRHIIMKNHVFTPLQYKQYWEEVDFDANVTKVENSNLADKNILFLGDATMYGALDYYAPTTGKGIAGRIALATGAKVTNLAIGDFESGKYDLPEVGYFVGGTGNTVIEQYQNRTDIITKYDAVVLWAGIHDFRNEKGTNATGVEAVVAAIRADMPNAKIFVINGPKRDTNYGGNAYQSGAYNNIKTWCETNGVYCVDLYNNEAVAALDYASSKYFPDGVNLTSDAYDVVYPIVLDVMEEAFEESDLVNLYYPLMKHTAPSYTILEYGEGLTANDRGTGSSIPTDIVRYREWQVSGRAFAVEAGDVLYFLAKSANDPFFKYDAEGNSLSTISGSGGYTSLVESLEVTNYGSFGWISNYEWFLCSVTIPEGVAFVAPAFTTDNLTKHFISKNRSFTRDEYNAYWAAFDVDANTGLTYDANSVLNGKKVLFMGDPTMYGINDYYAPTTGKGIAGRVALATGAVVTNIAASDFVSYKAPENGFLSGTTVAAQFEGRADTTTVYDAVVIWAGIHDGRYGLDNDDVLNAMKAVVADVEAAYPNVKIFVISGPYRDTNYGGNGKQGGQHQRFSAWGAESATDNHYYIDLYSPEEIKTALNYASAEYLPDGINPTSDGYDILAPYVISAMEEAYAHEHSVVFTDDSVKFDCAECADLKIKEIVKNEIADVRDGFEVIKLDANNFWFVTDAGFKNIVNGNVLTIGATTVLRVVDGALKAGSVKVADIADVDTFQIAVQIKNGGYVLYVNGDKVVSGAYIGEETITLGDEAFGARAKFLYNKAVTLGATDNAIVPSYKADKTNTECQHVGAAVNAALVNGKLVYDCGHCGERVYYATADTSVEAALANRTFDLRDKITVVELKTNKVDSVTAGDVVSIKRYGKDALVALSVDADGKLLTVGGTALTNKEGTAYSVLDSELDVVVVYDDENFKVRYYVEGYIAYANGVEAVLSVTETVASECGIAVNDAIVADYYCAAAKATEIFNYVGLQVHTESDMIRILSGIDAVWYDSVGYEVSVYDENGELVDVTKTVEGQTVYTSVGAAGEMVDASFYGYEFFAPLVINDIASASVGSTIVIRPFAKVGDISYKGGFVTISVTEEGYVAEKSVKFRVATANIGDFTGNNNPATDIAIQKATLEAVNADVFATQEDKAKLPDGLYPDYEYIARLGTGDYNYKAYLSNYKLGKTSKIYYDFDAAGLNDTINENPKVTLMDAISHGFFLYTTVEIEGYEIHLINVHVDWRSHEARIAQFKFILDFIDKNELEYVMVIGDMNPDDYTAYWDASSQTLKYRKNSGNSLHEEDLLLFTDRGEGKLNFKAANAGEFGTYHTILDHNGDPYQATRGAWDNILVSDNMVITNIEIIAEDWMNDHAFVAADIEIVK